MLRLLLALSLLALLPACYHLRVEPEPIAPREVHSVKPPAEAVRRLRLVFEEDLNQRVLEAAGDGYVLVTAPRQFTTETGLGQPPGGRQYYVQLHIEVVPRGSGSAIVITPAHYEIRTSYAYSHEGQLKTLYKHYPYEEYPGMFDNSLLEKELDDVVKAIRRGIRD